MHNAAFNQSDLETTFSMYLHYHDYLLDGRWVLTPGLDDDDRTALVGLPFYSAFTIYLLSGHSHA